MSALSQSRGLYGGQRPWVLVGTIFVVVIVVGSTYANKRQQFRNTSNLIEKERSAGTPVRIFENVVDITPEVGMKESMLDDTEILSDTGVTNKDQIEMDELNDDQDEPAILVEDKEDTHEELASLHQTVHEDTDEDKLDFEIVEDNAKQGHCRQFRRCYKKYCGHRRVCRQRCRRVHRCKPIDSCNQNSDEKRCKRILQCSSPRICRRACRFFKKPCGFVCRWQTRCCPKNARRYVRFCNRLFCTRKCIRKKRRLCRRFVRCYRHCRREMGAGGRRQCFIGCYRYWKCKHIRQCEKHCFARRSRCGYFCRQGDPKSCSCSIISKPVCGENGKTYRSACHAKCENVDVKCDGKCPCPTVAKKCSCPKTLAWCEKMMKNRVLKNAQKGEVEKN